MSDRFRVVSCKEAYENGYPGGEELREHGWALYQFEHGKPVALIGTDGGEPEDQTLARDWSWVAEALENAYSEGFNEGYGCAANLMAYQ